MAAMPGIRPAILSRQSHMYSIQHTSTAAMLSLHCGASESENVHICLAATQMQEGVFIDSVQFSVFNLTNLSISRMKITSALE